MAADKQSRRKSKCQVSEAEETLVCSRKCKATSTVEQNQLGNGPEVAAGWSGAGPPGPGVRPGVDAQAGAAAGGPTKRTRRSAAGGGSSEEAEFP